MSHMSAEAQAFEQAKAEAALRAASPDDEMEVALLTEDAALEAAREGGHHVQSAVSLDLCHH